MALATIERRGKHFASPTQPERRTMENGTLSKNINTDLNMDDVLTIVTSRAETKFNEKLSEARKEVSRLETAIKKKTEEIEKKDTEESLALVGERLAVLRPIVESLGGKVVTVSGGHYREKDTLAISVIFEKSGYRGTEYVVKGTKSPELLALEEEKKSLEGELEKAAAVAIEWKKKLSQIPQLERQYKAKIAQDRLEKTIDGKATLALLTEDLEQRMLALPGF